MISEVPHHLRLCSEITFARSLISLCNGCGFCVHSIVWYLLHFNQGKTRLPKQRVSGLPQAFANRLSQCLAVGLGGATPNSNSSKASQILCLKIPAYPWNATQLMQAHPSLPAFVGTVLRNTPHSSLESPVALSFSRPPGHPVQYLPILVTHRDTQFNIFPF